MRNLRHRKRRKSAAAESDRKENDLKRSVQRLWAAASLAGVFGMLAGPALAQDRSIDQSSFGAAAAGWRSRLAAVTYRRGRFRRKLKPSSR